MIWPFNRKTKIKLNIKFHTEATPFGEHGTLYANHPGLGLVNEPIRFVFVGIDAPKLSGELFNYIWAQAAAAGFVPLALRSYNTLVKGLGVKNPQVNTETPEAVAAANLRAQRRAEVIQNNELIAASAKRAETLNKALSVAAAEVGEYSSLPKSDVSGRSRVNHMLDAGLSNAIVGVEVKNGVATPILKSAVRQLSDAAYSPVIKENRNV